MTDKPIIFSAPMVRALLDGRKTQTRRLLKLPTKTHSGGPIYERKDMGGWAATTISGGGCFTVDRQGNRTPAPERPAIWHQTAGTTMALPYAPGDRLYVREAFAMAPAVRHPDRVKNVIYRADVPDAEPPAGTVLTMDQIMWAGAELCKWKPSIHMPRWASRLTLTVTEVRAQRLRDISEADARAEGIQPLGPIFTVEKPNGLSAGGTTARAAFAILWNSLHGPDAWDANPWVVAVSFTVQHRNIDNP